MEASSGRSLAEPGADWTRIDGEFRRFPVGVRKVGQIAATVRWADDFQAGYARLGALDEFIGHARSRGLVA